MPRFTVHRTERYLADKSDVSGPVADYVKGWSFAPPNPGNITNDLGLVVAQDLDPQSSLTLDAPTGARVLETGSGALALFLPGSTSGIAASDAVAMARKGQSGLSIV